MTAAARRSAPTRAGQRRVAVLAHGAGSDADFVLRAFPAPALGVDEVVALQDRTGDPVAVAASIEAAVRRMEDTEPRTRLVVGGVSLGAHAAARWCGERAGRRPAALVLALPAWTGAPGAVAAATRAASRHVAERGVARALADLAADPALVGDWVLEELTRAWPGYGDALLPAALARAGESPGPGLGRLRLLQVPAAVVALADDPLHPAAVAEEWAAALPHALLAVVPRHAPAADRAVLGRAAGRLLRDLGVGAGPGRDTTSEAAR